MLIPLTLPPPVRQFLADGFQLLIARLAALTEEFRAGLIAAIGRTVADRTEQLMVRVFPPGRPSSFAEDPEEFDDHHDGSSVEPNEATVFRSYDRDQFDPDDSYDKSRSERASANGSPPSSLMVRALVAAGLNALGVWLLRVGLVPTSSVIALFGGMMLMFRK
jgi:hypothetical protein